MKYLVKDLARLTGLSPARIRKWQERYNLLEPSTGANGYFYYSSDDLFLLQRINHRLEQGEALSRIFKNGREGILTGTIGHGFSGSDRESLALIAAGEFVELGERFDRECRLHGLDRCLRGPMREILRLVGTAWELGYLGVAEEHAYSRWFAGYLEKWIAAGRSRETPVWLVVTHPEDVHELGALLHYVDISRRGVPVRFCGNLPERELFRELAGRSYRTLSISVIQPRGERELIALRKRVRTRHPEITVLFGGSGYRGNHKTNR